MWRPSVKLWTRHVADVIGVDVVLARLFVASNGATVRQMINLRRLLVDQLVILVERQAGSLHVQRPLSQLRRGLMVRAPDADVGDL